MSAKDANLVESASAEIPRQLLAEDAEGRLHALGTLLGLMPARADGRQWVDAVTALCYTIALNAPAEDRERDWRRIADTGAADEWLGHVAEALEEPL